MKMMPSWVKLGFSIGLLLSGLLAGNAGVAEVAEAAEAADRTPQDVLKSKGLTLVGLKYLLENDAALSDWLRQVRAAEAKVDDYTRRRNNLERELTGMQDAADALYNDWSNEDDKLHHMQKSAWASYNLQVHKVNGMRERILEQLKVIDQRQTALGKLPDPSDEYVTVVVKFSAAIDQTSARYEKLAADADVTAALDAINKTAKPPVTLGPSERWAKEMPSLRFMVNKVNTDTINFIYDKNVPRVPVVFNDKVTVDAIVDSGAAVVSISEATAKKLNLTPQPGDKIEHIVTADGSIHEVHRMMLKSVRLGKFNVENVECVVTPSANGREVDTLLGGTFLRRFVYKMDLSAGQLKLSQVGERTADPGATASAANPAAPASPSAIAGGGGATAVQPPVRISLAGLSPGLRCEYFNGDNFERKIGERLDSRIACQWGEGAPAAGMPIDHFTVRWSGYIRAPQNGRYKFNLHTDDGARIAIGGNTLCDHWGDVVDTTFEVDLATSPQPIVMEVHENEGASHAMLAWGPADSSARLSIVPPSAFLVESEFAKSHALPGHGLHRTIFGDQNLEKPLVNDLDSNIDYYLARNAMAENTPQEHFSARWTGYLVAPEPGEYTLIALIDDGMRVWLDGKMVIEEWKGGLHTETATVTLDGKPHQLRVDYFQGTGPAHASLHWSKVGGFVECPIPASAFYPTSEAAQHAVEQLNRTSGAVSDAAEKRLAEIREYRKRVGEPAGPFTNPLNFASPVEGDATWPAAAGGYTLTGEVLVGYNDGNHGKDRKPFDGHLVIQPGFMLEGGKLIASRGVLELKGEPGRPIILRNVFLGCELTGQVKATNVVFEDCKFQKTGPYFWQWFSSKWELNQCVMIRSSFNTLSRTDYGFKIDRCTFVSSTFPARVGKPGKDDDMVKTAHSEWGHIADCDFYGCQFSSSSLWLLQRSNLYGCGVNSPTAFQSGDDLTVELGLLEEERQRLPQDAAAMASSTQAGHVTTKAAAGLFPTRAFPILAEAPKTPPVLPPAPAAVQPPVVMQPPPPAPSPSAPAPARPTTRGSSIFDQ